MADVIDMVIDAFNDKVPKWHPRRRFLVAMRYYGTKRSIQSMDDRLAAELVGKMFSVSADELYEEFWRIDD